MMRLTQRETLLAVGVGVLAVIWATYSLGISPALERIETLNREIPQEESELEQIRVKTAEYVVLRDGMEKMRTRIASQDETFELSSFVESLVNECGLSQNLGAMKPQTAPLGLDYSETVVGIEMKSVTLRQLLDFLVKLESSDVLINTKRLSIRKDPTDANLLDSELDISNLKLRRGQTARSSDSTSG